MATEAKKAKKAVKLEKQFTKDFDRERTKAAHRQVAETSPSLIGRLLGRGKPSDDDIDELDDDGVTVHLATYRGPILEILERTEIPERVGGIHEDVHAAAVAAAHGPQPPGANEHHRAARLSRWRTVSGDEHDDPLVPVASGA